MGTESVFRLISVLALGAFATACVALQSSSKAESVPSVSRQPIETEVNSLIEVQQINTGQFRPYELGSLKNFDDLATDPNKDPNL